MLSIAQVARLARGKLSPDELTELCSSMGIEIEMGEAKGSQIRDSFTEAANAVAVKGAKLHRVVGVTKDGARLLAILVTSPPAQKTA